ncbi:alpha/beta hydrolase [Colwellia psychrerythraea]|nr:alpha/beta hydrolase-fold protein [Colwellia psychrerythraea]
MTDDKLSIIVTPPADYNRKDTVHIVGNFNNWALSGNKSHQLRYVEGKLVADIPNNQQDIIFGFVRNSDWKSIPSRESGNALCLFLHQKNSTNHHIKIEIPAWKDDKPGKVATQTIVGNVKVLKDFAMPQLGRQTNISIYLPPSYKENNQQKYPVLYMLDGQNIFDDSTAYSDEWLVDESMERLASTGKLNEFIVVGIANGPRRWNEYNPWNYKSWDTQVEEIGEGDKTITFIRDSLKPFIDKNYRTKAENTSTGLAGSSLGGLMALYGAMEHSDVFGFIAAFSPSLAVENMAGNNVLFAALKNQKEMGRVKIYADMGKVEYGNYEKVEFLQQLLLESGVAEKNLKIVKDDLGRHCELDWSKRFPSAVGWLFKE